LANAPYYGLSRRVSSASRAVVLLGFSTVRALSVSAACGMLTEEVRNGASSFWIHSVTSAAAASVVARSIGFSTSDAFSAALLHDLGRALVQRVQPEAYDRVRARMADEHVDLLAAETAELGMTHAEAGAEVLEAWRFPDHFVRAVATHHHEPDRVIDTLGRLVLCGEALAGELEEGGNDEPHPAVEPALEALDVAATRAPRLLSDVQRELQLLAGFLRL
jgi:putative nucleotidyltransferase with HDIG domain